MAEGMLKGWTNRLDEVVGGPTGTVLPIEEPRSDLQSVEADCNGYSTVPFSRVRLLRRRRGHLAKI